LIYGILLAAGASRRFGSNKLLQPLADGTPVGVTSARHLAAAVDHTLAVVRSGADPLRERLQAEGVAVVVCPHAEQGMGVSLAWGVQAAANASGWLIALADMPFIQPATIRAIAASLHAGAVIAAPVCRGQQGHPVGFNKTLGEELMQLTGDRGARAILQRHAERLTLVSVPDPGIVQDIDTPAELGLRRI